MKTCLAFLFLVKTVAVFSQTSLFDSLEIVHKSEVFFAFGKYELTTAADSTISAFSGIYKTQSRPAQVRLTAHTDSIGGIKANLALSQKRVEAVRNQLIINGLDGKKISFRFFGESRPTAENATETGRQANRRATVEAIFVKKMATVSGQILDAETGQGIKATIVFRTKTAADSVMTDTSGKFAVRLPEGQVVGVETFADGHFFEGQIVKVSSQTPMILVKLPQVSQGAILPIKNLYFVGDEATLLPTSVPSLNSLLKFMRHNPGLKIEIAGHVNMPLQILKAAKESKRANKFVGNFGKFDDAHLMQLSVERAKTTLLYLKKGGIQADRMTFKGYSNSEMVFPYATTEAEQAANRRVEIRVLDMGENIRGRK